ncbi:MAG: glycosyltransferase family 2 protein [Defluviicoccus sp.]|nr:glycosyltransferase family 2 protein [Defluviicoccus sp.]MDG4609652.1 glycosyltransferase family 2 protein [Defluviicoccus sp.]
MTLASPPRVAIGIPVFNGQNYIADAIESVLAQTFEDFELVISDNASTDGTESVCRAYAARDFRIRYHRSAYNRGAACNYDLVYRLCSPTTYFKWLAHDDRIAPTFLAKAVAALDADSEAALCSSLVQVIDDKGEQIRIYDSDLIAARVSERPSERFAVCILKSHRNSELFALIRRSAFERIEPMAAYYNSDKVIIAELALLGRFLQIDEPLIANREHQKRATTAVVRAAWAAYHDSKGGHWNRFGHLMVYRDYVRMVHRHLQDWPERRNAYASLLKWWGAGNNLITFCADAVAFVSPKAFVFGRRLKHQLLRPAAPKCRAGTDCSGD